MHLAYCLHLAPTLGTRLIHCKKCGKEATIEEELGRMSNNTAISSLSFQWVLLTWRFVSSGQTVNKRRTQPMKTGTSAQCRIRHRSWRGTRNWSRHTLAIPQQHHPALGVLAVCQRNLQNLFSTQLAFSRGSVSFLFASRTLGQKGRLANGT